MRRYLIILLLIALVIVLVYTLHPPKVEDPTWGINFSEKQARRLGLDWKESYLSILQDMGVKHLRLMAHWDDIEPQDQAFDFENLDWQMDTALENGAEVILAIGMRTPRWPECHIPAWAKDSSDEQLRAEILEMIKEIVPQYMNHPALSAWQVENEPLFGYGYCPSIDQSFLREEIELVKSLDPSHEIITSDSGELSMWFDTAREVDRLAITLYRKVWSLDFDRYLSLPMPISSYSVRAWLIDKILGKKIFVGELQAEPWVDGELIDVSIEEMGKTLTVNQLRENIDFARKTGLDTFYLWGAEWWYYMKENRDQGEFWEVVQELFSTNLTSNP